MTACYEREIEAGRITTVTTVKANLYRIIHVPSLKFYQGRKGRIGS